MVRKKIFVGIDAYKIFEGAVSPAFLCVFHFGRLIKDVGSDDGS